MVGTKAELHTSNWKSLFCEVPLAVRVVPNVRVSPADASPFCGMCTAASTITYQGYRQQMHFLAMESLRIELLLVEIHESDFEFLFEFSVLCRKKLRKEP